MLGKPPNNQVCLLKKVSWCLLPILLLEKLIRNYQKLLGMVFIFSNCDTAYSRYLPLLDLFRQAFCTFCACSINLRWLMMTLQVCISIWGCDLCCFVFRHLELRPTDLGEVFHSWFKSTFVTALRWKQNSTIKLKYFNSIFNTVF